jgi:hypothetical protein
MSPSTQIRHVKDEARWLEKYHQLLVSPVAGVQCLATLALLKCCLVSNGQNVSR